jgi:hypothetical protein
MHKVIHLISNFLYSKKIPFYESTYSFGEFDEKSNYTKNSKSWNFEEKSCKAKDSFFKLFDEKIMFNKFKIFNFRSKSHV